MRNRLIAEITIVGLPITVSFFPDMLKYLIVWLGWCNSISDEPCIGQNFFTLITGWIVFWIVLFIFVELVFWRTRNKKEKQAFDINKIDDIYETVISVTNKSYSIIENCFIELVRVNVLNKKGCRKFFDKDDDVNNEMPRLFIWDNGTEIKNLVKNVGTKFKLCGATKKEELLLLTKIPMECLFIFPDRRRGTSFRKAKYQIEIKISGKVVYDGIEKIIENTSFWEIKYVYRGHFNSQNVWMERIEKLQDVNDLDLGEIVHRKKSINANFSLVENPSE